MPTSYLDSILGQATPKPSPAALRNGVLPMRGMSVLGELHHAYRRAP